MNQHGLFSAKILDISDVATDTKKFSFEILGEEKKDFLAGQFFLLGVDEKVSRAYSIASAPESLPRFDLLIKKVPGGAATENFLWKKSAGDTVDFRGPMGRFGVSSDVKKHIFIATGTGLAPMRALWQKLLAKENPPEIHLFFGVRSEEFLFCEEEILEIQKKFPNFSVTFCLSQATGEGNFFHGRVTDLAREKSAEFFENAEISLCGAKVMIAEIKEILVEKNFEGKLNVEGW